MKPALLLISHACTALENRKKPQALAEHFDIVCVTSAVEQGTVYGRPSSDFDNDSDAASRGYQLVRLPRRGGSDTTFRYAGLAAVMRSRRFDVILVENEPWSVVCWQARFWKALLQRKALFGEFTWENVERPGWKGLVLSVIYRLMAVTTDFIIAGNQAAGRLVQKHGMRPDTVHVAPQIGVDPGTYCPASPGERRELRLAQGLPPDAFLIGYCGRLTEEKGIGELVQACGEFQDVHLALLGSGTLGPWLEEQRSSRPWLHLLPSRPHFEIPSFLRCLDLFVLGSKPVRSMAMCWEEQFGHVLIEAMACGVATIGSDSGAIPEVIGDPEAVFPWGNAGVLTDCIRRARSRPGMAGAQLERTLRLYTHEAIATSWAGFINRKLAA